MGRKCGISDCASDSNRPEDIGVTFHKVPLHPDIRPKWMSLCRIPEDKQMMKVVYICSRHFLRADFCSFKGKKYMLKQGVLPSVFPWNKGQLQARKSDEFNPKMPVIKKEPVDGGAEDESMDSVESEEVRALDIKTEPTEDEPLEEVLSPKQTSDDSKVKTLDTPTGLLTFTPDERIEALDFNQTWCPAKIIEVDYQENEVLVHFEKYSNQYDEWIGMNSNALRAIREPSSAPPSAVLVESKKFSECFVPGERVMASWSDSRKFPATVNKSIDKDTYEVLFDDGFVKTLKSHRIAKCQAKTMQSSPLFDASKVTKQERRDRKRKINISALFRKRQRTSSQEEKAPTAPNEPLLSPSEDFEYWSPSWEHGRPVGEESAIETADGMKKSVIVPDPRIPPKWQKHLTQRTHGASAGKWDTLIVSPDGRKFRTRTEIRTYIEENPQLKLSEAMFDFSIYRRSRNKRQPAEVIPIEAAPTSEPEPDEVDNQNSLKIPMIDNSYKCPIEGCGKNFRRENLAQMHVKHYHPEYTKFLDSTPNVADLAYARTVGESLDRSPGPEKRTVPGRQIQKTSTPKMSTPKHPQSPSLELEQKSAAAPKKDQEIIKLLNSKPFDIKQEDASPQPILPSGLPPNMYPDIKLKDLLTNKSDIGSKRDDFNFRPTTRPPGSGIKTLLPVIRHTEPKVEEPADFTKSLYKQPKKKRVVSESVEPVKMRDDIAGPPPSDQSNVIIEGGEVIKIVRMKREEIINCTCGITEEDGLMIQCELCLCWQHAYCNNIERENQVPEKYICYICQNPIRQRSSKKYFHDQDWLKHGSLPVGSYHCKDNEALQKRFEKLKKSHDVSGAMLELKEFLHTMRIKIKIAEAKNHPKLYLWSKPWDKPQLPEKEDNQNGKVKMEEPQEESMLLSLLKPEKESKLKDELNEFPKLDINSLMDNNLDNIAPAPIIPQPEAAIESDDCRINLLEHIAHCQSLIEQRMDIFEQQISALDVGLTIDEDPETYPRTRQTTEMIVRDLNTMNEFAHVNSF